MVEDEIIHPPYNMDWNGVVHPTLPPGATQIGWPQTVWRAHDFFWFFTQYKTLCPICGWRRSIWGKFELATEAAIRGAIYYHQRVNHGIETRWNNG